MNKIFLFPAACLLLMAGCTADEQPDAAGLVPLSLSATVEDGASAATRAGTSLLTSFANGDAFYAYFPSNVTVGSTTSASNTTFSYNGTKWSPGTQPYFNAGTTNATVHAYYPYVTGKQVTNVTTSFSVETDQSTEANYKKSDLMYATATVQKSSPTASLSFSHKMAKILVTANIGAGVTNIQSVKIIGGYRTINISTPQSCTLGSALSNANSSTNITMWSGTSTSAVSCAALIPPQTINGNFLQIVTNAGTATYSLSSKQFETGKSYQLTITVNAAALGTTVAITGWTGTGAVTVSPTDSNYPTIGSVMCSNGHFHATVSAVTCGGVASGMVAYLGSQTGLDGLSSFNGYSSSSSSTTSTFKHGLVIALEDSHSCGTGSNIGMTGTPSAVGNTENPYVSSFSRERPVNSSMWLAPSACQFERMLMGCGSTSAFLTVDDITGGNSLTFLFGNINNLLDACGGTRLKTGDYSYWTSTCVVTGSITRFKCYKANGDGYFWNVGGTSGYVRTCFAF